MPADGGLLGLPPAAFTPKDSLVVLPNDVWDATEMTSLFYFRTSDVLPIAERLCKGDPERCEGEADEAGPKLLPYLRQVKRAGWAHLYEREGGYPHSQALMHELLILRAPGLVCYAHRTFIEMGSPRNFKLRWKGGRPTCSEGRLVQLGEIELGADGQLRYDGDVLWPAFTGDRD
jgi:hypothetical protein